MHCGFTEEMDERVPGQISAAAGAVYIQRSGSGSGCWNSYDTIPQYARSGEMRGVWPGVGEPGQVSFSTFFTKKVE